MSKTSLAKNLVEINPFDPFQASTNALLVIAFPKSNSKNFPFALSLAEGAEQYGFFRVQGQPMHVALFGKNAGDAGRAVAVLRYISGWRGALIFSKGKILGSSWEIMGVLECYLDSSACTDFRAHCYKVIDDPTIPVVRNASMSFSFSISERPTMKKMVEIDQYVFPCKYALPYFRYQLHHPSSVEEQIKAAGAGRSCQICPNFQPAAYKKVGARVEQRDAFDY